METDCSSRGKKLEMEEEILSTLIKKSLDFNSDNVNLTEMNKGRKLEGGISSRRRVITLEEHLK